MTSMMKDVVCYGTAKYAKVPGYVGRRQDRHRAAEAHRRSGAEGRNRRGCGGQRGDNDDRADGETNPAAGTDYQANDGSKEYYSTFVGYFPADNPQVTILVSIDRPDPSNQDHLGGKAAGPLFSTLATIAMHELKVSPTPNDTGCQTSEG